MLELSKVGWKVLSVGKMLKLLVLSCVLAICSLGGSASSDVAAFMKHLEVIPDVISEAPKDFLTVSTRHL